MKNKNIIYGFAIGIVIVGYSLKLMHFEYASFILNFALILGVLIENWHLRQLEKELEKSGEQQNKFLMYGIMVFVVGAATLEVLHLTFGETIFRWSLIAAIIVIGRNIQNLEKKLNEKRQVRLD